MVHSVGVLKSRRCSTCRCCRPRRVGVGEVVHRARGPRLERARRPHAGKRPAEELRRGATTVTSSPSGSPTTGVRERNVRSSSTCSRAVAISVPGAGCCSPWSCARLRWGLPPLSRPAIAAEFVLRAPSSRASRWRADGPPAAEGPPRRRSFCSNVLEPEPEGALRARAEIGLQILDVGAGRLHRLARTRPPGPPAGGDRRPSKTRAAGRRR